MVTKMQAANRAQRALRTSSGPSFGAWQMLPGTNHSRTIARCGYDWVTVDTEHGNIDGTALSPRPPRRKRSRENILAMLIQDVDSNMHEAVAAIAACGVSPLVRIAANEGWMVKRRLYGGKSTIGKADWYRCS